MEAPGEGLLSDRSGSASSLRLSVMTGLWTAALGSGSGWVTLSLGSMLTDGLTILTFFFAGGEFASAVKISFGSSAGVSR